MTDPSPAPRSLRSTLDESRGAVLLSLALFVAGVVLRLHLYFDRRSLWLDEVWVALNIVRRSFLELARPLEYAQSAPIGFLWAERLAVVIGGVNELALRALPLLAGCALLVALWMLARRLFDVRFATLCLAFAALSPLLIYFSNEVKPYILDALMAVVLTWATLDVLEAPDSSRAWLRLAGAGVLGILASTPSVFVLTAVGIALIAHPAIGRTRAGWARLLGTGAVWLTLFVVGYLTIYRGTASSEYMQRIWSGSFLSLPLRTLAHGANDASRLMWIETMFGASERLLPPKAIMIVTLLAAGGAVVLARRRGASVALLVVLPFIVTAAASFAHRWPLTPRLLLALVPGLILLLATGVWALAELLPTRVRGTALALLGAVILIPASAADARAWRAPNRRDDVAPLVRHFMTVRREPAVAYVVGHSAPSWLFYTARWKEPEDEAFRVAAARAYTPGHFPSRACITQEPGLRVVFGPTGKDFTSDSALSREADWLVSQRERDLWVLTVGNEHEAGHGLEHQLVARGAVLQEEQSRQGGEMRHFRLPAGGAGEAAACDAQPLVRSGARAARTSGDQRLGDRQEKLAPSNPHSRS